MPIADWIWRGVGLLGAPGVAGGMGYRLGIRRHKPGPKPSLAALPVWGWGLVALSAAALEPNSWDWVRQKTNVHVLTWSVIPAGLMYLGSRLERRSRQTPKYDSAAQTESPARR